MSLTPIKLVVFWLTLFFCFIVTDTTGMPQLKISCSEIQSPHFMSNNVFLFRKSRRLRDNMEEYGRARLATDDNIAHAPCMLHNFFSPSNRGVYDIMWKNMVEPVRPQMTIGCMRYACSTIMAADTHWEYVIFLLFHGNNGYANAPRCYVYTYIACYVSFKITVVTCLRAERRLSSLDGNAHHTSAKR